MMKYSYNLLQDWKPGNSKKGKLIMLLFRIAHLAGFNKPVYFIMLPYSIFYKITVEWLLGIELPRATKIGKGTKLYHGQSLVINRHTVIGQNCTIRHCTTIGNLNNEEGRYKCPRIGNNVDIGANTCILGDIEIGDNVKIGAGSVVTKSIPPNSVAVGNPAKVIKTITPDPVYPILN